MPQISSFYGIVILMYYYDNKGHHRPHIHAEYGEHEASIAIEDASVLSGSLPARQLNKVRAWVRLRRPELLQDWALAIVGKKVLKIQPLP